jgi:uncharacterized repeat protein (TIGR03803 family)
MFSSRHLSTRHWTRVFAAALGILLGAVMGGNAFAQNNEKVLHSFSGPLDGILPVAELVTDSAGNLFGTASQGGASNWGTVFKISPEGAFTLLYSFTGGSDGGNPGGPLYIDKRGNLFGTTMSGGKAGCGEFGQGCGVVFELSPSGTYSVLYAFSGAKLVICLLEASLQTRREIYMAPHNLVVHRVRDAADSVVVWCLSFRRGEV